MGAATCTHCFALEGLGFSCGRLFKICRTRIVKCEMYCLACRCHLASIFVKDCRQAYHLSTECYFFQPFLIGIFFPIVYGTASLPLSSRVGITRALNSVGTGFGPMAFVTFGCHSSVPDGPPADIPPLLSKDMTESLGDVPYILEKSWTGRLTSLYTQIT
jgi:hypothetical protein